MNGSPLLGLSIHELELELKRSEATIGQLIIEQSTILKSLDFYVSYTEAVRAEIAFRRSSYTTFKPKPVTFSMIETDSNMEIQEYADVAN